jgi:hypothetical protein
MAWLQEDAEEPVDVSMHVQSGHLPVAICVFDVL